MKNVAVMTNNKSTVSEKLIKVLCVILAIVLGLGSVLIISRLFGGSLKAVFPNYWARQFVDQLIMAIIGLALIFIFRKQKVLKFTAEGMKEGLICGAAWTVMLLLAVANLFLNQMSEPGLHLISWWEISFLVLQCLLIGLFEEGVFRGVATELSLELFGDEKKSNARLAIAFTSFLFGAVHLINAFQPEVSLKAASMQGIAAFGGGLVYGAIFYRSQRCIWPCVIWHALQDLAAFTAGGSLFGVTQEEAIGNTGFGQAALSILFIIWFFYLMREQETETVQ
ncbi:MAG: CPBP family intramembrane metalloprotease [Lachnospiraceae bacterium]|nr:CPBP family intramembrane metalloprotease [Lachnospiraceae bacterium]MBR6956695.1 CPBP family intramembrane metalloprotease [Bacillota bacterium]